MDGLLRLGSRLGHRLDGPELLDPLGRPVADPDAFLRAFLQLEDIGLAREDAHSHFDQLPVSLLTTATLDWVREAAPCTVVDERRFRPNIVVRTPPGTPPFVEDTWFGRQAATADGSGPRFALVRASERCAMSGAPQPGLPEAPEILKALLDAHDGRLDALAEVSRPGRLSVGDSLALI